MILFAILHNSIYLFYVRVASNVIDIYALIFHFDFYSAYLTVLLLGLCMYIIVYMASLGVLLFMYNYT